jgi:catechol 2,3-dioxygenase-like lactoylglutathione lyase family enzyme
MSIGRLDHYSIRTLDLASSERFYTQIMGFQVGPRPPFKFPGIWLYNGAPQPGSNGVVHIIGIDLNDVQGLVDYLGDVDVEKLKDGTGTVFSCDRPRRDGGALRRTRDRCSRAHCTVAGAAPGVYGRSQWRHH